MKKDKIITLLLTLLSAFLLVISTADNGVSITAFIGFVPILFAVKRNNIHPLLLGWLLGFIYWMVGLSWMMTTFSYFGNAPIYGSLALLLFISTSGGFLFFAPFTYVARKYLDQPLLLALLFIALETAKSTLFFGGVPWLNLAQSQYDNLIFIQFVSVFGEYGLSLLIMLINLFIFYLLAGYERKKYSLLLASAVILMIIPGLYRQINPMQVDDTKNVLVIQTGFDQKEKWKQNVRYNLISELNQRLINIERDKYDLIILPESSYPARVLDTKFIYEVLKDVAYHTPIIVGSDMSADNIKLGKKTNHNVLILFDDVEEPVVYKKRKLTPFGEYFPFEKFLYPIRKFFFGEGEMYTPGDEAIVFETGSIKAAPIICWEGAFSNLVNDSIQQGANLITMSSNDTWFGFTAGRYQHIAVDIVRAVEHQRTMVRSTQDGISAIILPNGLIVKAIYGREAGEISYDVPLISEKTFFSIFGYSYLLILLVIAFALLRKSKKNK